jgi:hypothetical protein
LLGGAVRNMFCTTGAAMVVSRGAGLAAGDEGRTDTAEKRGRSEQMETPAPPLITR